jgi:hypothetical protein
MKCSVLLATLVVFMRGVIANDEQVIAQWAKTGKCFDYVTGKNAEKAIAPCKIWCEKNGGLENGYGVSIAKLNLHLQGGLLTRQ